MARHCEVTRNPCGTDTWMKNHPCQCPECQAWMCEEVDALRTERDGLREELEEERRQLREETLDGRERYHAQTLQARDVESPCDACSGLGVRWYSSTATWAGGIGGQAITASVCDRCWGSGDSARPWPSWRERQALAAENAGLREALSGVKETMDDAFHDAGGPGNHYTIPVCLFCGNEDGHQAGCVAPTVDRALASPSPITRAVQRALGAVGESKRLADALEDLGHPDDEDEYEEVAAAYEAAMKELDAAHDALQALLEGKGEAP